MNEDAQVYFIQEQRGGDPADNLIKIGFSKDVHKRCFTLKFARKCPVVILATFPGSWGVEQKLHAHFAAYHVAGEWFRPCKDILDMVKSDTLPALPDVVVTPIGIRTNIYMTADLWRRWRISCIERGTSASAEIAALVEARLKELKQDAPVPAKKKGGKP